MDPRLRGDDVRTRQEVGGEPSARSSTEGKLLDLIRASIALWQIGATVSSQADGTLLITLDDGTGVSVGRAPAGIPFRWMVTTPTGRERPASSITGLLRVLRSTLDADWRAGRARVVPVTLPVV